ncbi:MAG: spore coat associated protein CotJA [Clostridia bacterium]|nr:spore coat associated protein CotJA [Clostridia bacterium]
MEPLDQFVAEMMAFEESMFPAKISLAMSYVPNQPFENLYGEDEALGQGTLCRSLNFPIVGGKHRGTTPLPTKPPCSRFGKPALPFTSWCCI